MQNELLLALFTAMLDERLEKLPDVYRGKRGPRGHPGRDGDNFVFSEHEEKFRAIAEEFALTFDKLNADQIAALRGPRGFDGKDFNFAEHADEIKAWVHENKLKFSDLTDEEIESLRGPRGQRGRRGETGADGKSFVFAEHRTEIASILNDAIDRLTPDLKLKFSDLTEEERESLKGAPGRHGRDGHSFVYDEHAEEITHTIAQSVEALAPDLKLKFEDLSEEEKEELKGRPGRDGRDGKSFVFAEHEEYFRSLKLKFEDLSDDERDSLKLRFHHLTDEEKNSLKLRFEHLSEDDKNAIRGPRGLRGQRGKEGNSSKWIVGNGPPVDPPKNLTDVYLDSLTGDIYEWE